MALLHRADLSPSKLELLTAWLPSQRWWLQGHVADLARVASYRFDDPAGEVGIETMLVRAGDGPVYQVPLTYRGAPLDDGDQWLVGTTEHSVLGHRWVFDACGDPVYAAALASAILDGAGQAEEFFEVDGRMERREPSMTIVNVGGTGATNLAGDDPTLIASGRGELAVLRYLDSQIQPAGPSIAGSWPGQALAQTLAYAI